MMIVGAVIVLLVTVEIVAMVFTAVDIIFLVFCLDYRKKSRPPWIKCVPCCRPPLDLR